MVRLLDVALEEERWEAERGQGDEDGDEDDEG